MTEPPVVLDASALLALLRREKGADLVLAALPVARMSTVNLAEVASKLADYGVSPEQAEATVEGLDIAFEPFDATAAHASARLRNATRGNGLSLGDRACLALAQATGAVVLTTDPAWAALALPGAAIRLIR